MNPSFRKPDPGGVPDCGIARIGGDMFSWSLGVVDADDEAGNIAERPAQIRILLLTPSAGSRRGKATAKSTAGG